MTVKLTEKKVDTSKVITEEVRQRADKIKASLELDANTGVVSVKKDAKPFLDTLTNNVTEKDVKQVMTALGDFAVASGVAFGEIAMDGLKKHKNLGQIQAAIPLTGHDKIKHRMDRLKTGTNPGTNERWEKKGVLTSSATLHGLTSSKGSMKKLAAFFSEEAATKL